MAEGLDDSGPGLWVYAVLSPQQAHLCIPNATRNNYLSPEHLQKSEINEWVEKQELAKRNGGGRKQAGLRTGRSKDLSRGMKETALSVVARRGPSQIRIDPPPPLLGGLGSPTQPRAPGKSRRIGPIYYLPRPKQEVQAGWSGRAVPLTPRGERQLVD